MAADEDNLRGKTQSGTGRRRAGNPRRQSGAVELWERGGSHLQLWKLSRVLTESTLPIKITAIQRGGLALFGVGHMRPLS